MPERAPKRLPSLPAVSMTSRSLLIDTLKVVAAQIIVLHHLSLYAPMADLLADRWPTALAWLREHGRLAVQPFLVMGGFLAARSLGQRGPVRPWRAIVQRYWRLAPPFWAAVALVIIATVLLNTWVEDFHWVSPLPSVGGLLAHALLIQDLVGVPALSAGAWYVAIDLQLFGLMVLAYGALQRGRQSDMPSALIVGVALLTIASLTWLSRLAHLDMWAPYFWYAYGLGVMTAWASRSPIARRWWLALLAVFALDLLLGGMRPRPVAALACALILWWGHRPQRQAALLPAWAATWRQSLAQRGRAALSLGSDVSYGLFVSHFAVIIVATALWERNQADRLSSALIYTAVAVGASWLTGWGFQRFFADLPSPWARKTA